MNGQQGPRSGSSAGSVIVLVIAVLAVLAWIGAHMTRSEQVTSCNTVTQTCTQTDYPIQSQGP
jgi:hypothetical protein